MLKQFLLRPGAIILLCALSISLTAQDYSLPTRLFKGQQLDAVISVGALPTYVADKTTVHVPPVSAGINYLVSSVFGVDALVGYSVSESPRKYLTDNAYATWTNTLLMLAVRPTVHFTRRDNIDIYGGMAASLHYTRIEGNPGGDLSNTRLAEFENHLGIRDKVQPVFSGFLGARYALTPQISFSAEVGFNVSILSVGVGYRLK
ncbi:MAG: hypothetical protein KatS3mg030_264 [Saprospiraceae bacterium]|nr:MAG: hypothetical protein KatS3mg030_264 [Saprospiraceae bacterium]